MYWEKKDFFNINKSPLVDFDKEKLFYWFCRNHQKDAPEGLLKPMERVNENLKENENLFQDINDNGNFDQIIDNNSKTIFTIQENYEFWNGIYKFYDLYFFHGLELDTIGPLSLEEALDEHYIIQERDDDQLLDIEYDEGEITWKQIQSIMSSNKPSLDAEIIVNNKQYIHKSNGLWVVK